MHFASEHIVRIGTDAGSVFAWDRRGPTTRAAWTRGVSARRYSVAEFQIFEEQLYTGLISDTHDRHMQSDPPLAAWDLRVSEKPLQMPRRFRGHVNSGRRLQFAVDESGVSGLLAAPGSDGVVRMWDAKRSGHVLKEISCKREWSESKAKAKFVGWEREDRPAWVKPSLLVESTHWVHAVELSEVRADN